MSPAANNAEITIADRPSRIRYRVLAWMCAIAAIAYLQRNSMAVTKESLGKDLDVDSMGLGQIVAAFYLGYAVFQIPGGLLRDYWGTRTTLVVVVLAGSLATALMACVTDPTVAQVTWLTVGACQAALFPCAVAAIRQWFPSTERATAAGWLASCMSLGGAAATSLAGHLLGVMSWRGVFALLAGPGVAWSVMFALAYRSRPDEHPAVNEAELSYIRGKDAEAAANTDVVHGRTPWLTVFCTPSLVVLYAQQFFRAAGAVFYGTWFTTYLQQSRGVDVTTSGMLTSLPQLGIMGGSLAGGLISDNLLRRTGSQRLAYQGVAIVSLLACGSLILSSYLVTNATLAVVVIMLGHFCGSIAGPSAYTLSIEKSGRHVSTVFSTMNMAGNLGAMTFPWLLPSIRDAAGWDMVLFSVAGLYGAAACCWLGLTPRRVIHDT